MDGKQIGERASALAKQTVTAGNRAASAVGDAANKAADQVSELGEDLYENGAQAAQTLGRTIQKHPMATVLIAAAVGFGLGRLAHRD